jgi:hypothetical protein
LEQCVNTGTAGPDNSAIVHHQVVVNAPDYLARIVDPERLRAGVILRAVNHERGNCAAGPQCGYCAKTVERIRASGDSDDLPRIVDAEPIAPRPTVWV